MICQICGLELPGTEWLEAPARCWKHSEQRAAREAAAISVAREELARDRRWMIQPEDKTHLKY